MADEIRNTLQDVIREVREILEPVARGIQDAGVRREIMLALGLDGDPAAHPLSIPPAPLESIDAYRSGSPEDADLQAFISVLQDITQVIQALIDFVRSVEATDDNAPPGFIAEEAVSFYLSSITLAYLRLRQPGVYIAAKVLQLVEEQGLRFGGFIDLLFRTGEYFENLWGAAKKLQTPQDAKTVSDVALFVPGAVLAHFIKGDFIYGYDAGTGSASPLGDAASNRTLTLRATGKVKDLTGNTVKSSLLGSFALMPRDHGGPGLLMRFQGDGSVEVPLDRHRIQVIYNDAEGGTFTLSFRGAASTAAIAFDASASALKAALEDLSNIDTVEVAGAGTRTDPWLVEFVNPSGRSVPLLTGDGTGLVDGRLTIEESSNLSLRLTVEAPDLIFYVGEGAHNFPTSTEASVTARVAYKSTPKVPIIWGDVKGIHLRIGSFAVEGNASTEDIGIKADVSNSAFVLATDSADGFLKTILDTVASGGALETTFEFNIGYSKKKGFFVGGGMGLMLAIPLHETLGPIAFNTLIVGIALGERAGKEPGIKLEASLSFGMDLGVLQASVDRIGLAGIVAFDDGDVSLEFKPPNGVGLAIDAGVVRGGGFLNFDFERGEYAGGLEIDISGIVTITALGIITTRMPDGSEGFSLVIIMSVEFGTPIQLGFGFTLIGVGGLLGLNRTMRLELIAEGLRTGAANSILFPRNIVANAARIVSDLRSFFPAQADTFLIGPMVKIGWGTPTLVSVSLGVLIQIPPGNVAILGVLKCTLPDEEAAVLKLQVAFIGALEVDKDRLWFYATLYDSRVLFMTLEGSIGLLVAWGENSNFVLSSGGFHPQFDPPNALPFPIPERLAIVILDYPLARIRVMAYFAVTSNTAQFGARAELFFGFDNVSIEGHLAFDALFRFSPFFFIITISASVSLKVFGAGLFSVRLKGSLEGPTPWRIAGAASVSILFFEISVDFDETWGEAQDTTLPAQDAMPLLVAEVEKVENWTAELPSGTHLLVSLRAIEASTEGLVLHPVGRLRVSQRALPLEIKVDKVGNQRVADANRFRLRVDGGGLEEREDSEEPFAIAQFQEISDSQKLGLPAYQREVSGKILAAEGSQRRVTRLVKRRVRFELIIIDTAFKRFARPFFDLWVNLFNHFLKGASIGMSTLSHKRAVALEPFAERIAVRETPYVVANVRDNRPWNGAASFGSEARAREYMSAQIAANPGLARELHVIPSYEVSEAA